MAKAFASAPFWTVPYFEFVMPYRSLLANHATLMETLFENAPLGLSVVDHDFRFVRVNQTLAGIDGARAGEMLGKQVREVVPLLWPKLEPLYQRALAGETIVNQDVSGIAIPGSGEVRHWLVSYYPIWHESKVIGIGAIVNDVTSRRLAEESLRIRNDLYAMLSRTNRAVSRCRSCEELFQEVCNIAIETGRFKFAWVGVPEDGRVKMVASAGDDGGYMESLVITLDEADPRSHGPTGRAAVLGKSFVVNDFMHSPMTALWKEKAQRVGFAASAAFPLKERDTVAAVLTLYAPVANFFTEDLVSALSEVTPSLSFALDAFVQERERKRDEADLLLRDRAMKAVSQGIIITDTSAHDFPIVYVSPGFEQTTGYSAREAMERNCEFLQGSETDPAAVAQVLAAIRDGKSCNVEMVNYRKDGTPFWNSFALSPVRDEAGRVTHFIGVVTDVTQRRKLEEQYRQAQKMEAIGQLAGGIAHDFNNLLTIITGYTELVLDAMSSSDPQRELLEEISDAAARSASLTRQLLTFSRKQVLLPKVLDLSEVVHGVEKMLKRIIGEDIELMTNLTEGGSCGVKADPGQLEQVLLNLAVNARDAMPHGGKITISTKVVALSKLHGFSPIEQPDGEYVMLSVADTGTGMKEEVKRHLFEPFFTTKDKDKGTGLGLAVVHGIVKQSDGEIEVISQAGEGATFNIYLPRHLAAPNPQDHARSGKILASAEETILVVEDDEAVRTLARFALEGYGYQVLEASCGTEALELSAQHQGAIDLLLADVVMPGMNGRILSEKFAELRPGTQVLFLSGYMDDAVVRSGILHEQVAFLQKPFSPRDLVDKVRALLAKGNAEKSLRKP